MVIVDIKEQITGFLERVKENWQPLLEEKGIIQEHEPDMKEYLSKARREWREAQTYFNNVSEPELVDHAAYLLRAAESKYMYLLKKYKEKQINNL